MKEKIYFVLAFSVLLMTNALGAVSSVKEKSAVPVASDEVKVGGEIFFEYKRPLENAAAGTYNGFDITRAYIDFKKQLSGKSSFRLTLDVARLDSQTLDTAKTSQQLFDFLKYAYADLPLDLPLKMKAVVPSASVRLGLQPTVWIAWAEKLWGKRYIAKEMTDNESLLSSSDFGAGLAGKFLIKDLPEIEYQATLTNGSGFKKQETNQSKDLGIRLNTEFLASKKTGSFVAGIFANWKDQAIEAGSGTKQAGILVGYRNEKYGNVYVEYVKGTKISGYSIGGFICPLPDKLSAGLIARTDNYNPDTTASNNEIKRTFLGTFWDISKDVSLAFDIQTKQTGSGSIERIAYLHSRISY